MSIVTTLNESWKNKELPSQHLETVPFFVVVIFFTVFVYAQKSFLHTFMFKTSRTFMFKTSHTFMFKTSYETLMFKASYHSLEFSIHEFLLIIIFSDCMIIHPIDFGITVYVHNPYYK